MNESMIIIQGVGGTNMVVRENENTVSNMKNSKRYNGDHHEESEEYTILI